VVYIRVLHTIHFKLIFVQTEGALLSADLLQLGELLSPGFRGAGPGASLRDAEGQGSLPPALGHSGTDNFSLFFSLTFWHAMTHFFKNRYYETVRYHFLTPYGL
jgi:hypothetical protein